MAFRKAGQKQTIIYFIEPNFLRRVRKYYAINVAALAAASAGCSGAFASFQPFIYKKFQLGSL